MYHDDIEEEQFRSDALQIHAEITCKLMQCITARACRGPLRAHADYFSALSSSKYRYS